MCDLCFVFRVTGGELFEDIVAREYYSEADARWVYRPLSFRLPSLPNPASFGRRRPQGPHVLLWAERLTRLRQTVCRAEAAFLLGAWSTSQEQPLLCPPPDRSRLESGSARASFASLGWGWPREGLFCWGWAVEGGLMVLPPPPPWTSVCGPQQAPGRAFLEEMGSFQMLF